MTFVKVYYYPISGALVKCVVAQSAVQTSKVQKINDKKSVQWNMQDEMKDAVNMNENKEKYVSEKG